MRTRLDTGPFYFLRALERFFHVRLKFLSAMRPIENLTIENLSTSFDTWLQVGRMCHPTISNLGESLYNFSTSSC